MKIRTQLLALIAAVLAPVLALIVSDTVSLWTSQREVQEERFLERVSALRLALDTELDGTVRVLRSMSDSADLDQADRLPAFRQRFERLLANYPAWSTIAYRSTAGETLARADRQAVGPRNAIDDATVADATQRRGVAISNVVVERDGAVMTYVAVPAVRADRVLGVLWIGIPNESWLAFLRSYPIADGATLTLNDREGGIVARTLNNERWAGKVSTTAYFDRIRDKPEGTFNSTGLEGQSFYSAFSRSRTAAGWTLGSGVPKSHVETALAGATWNLIVGLTAAIGLALVFALVLSERIAVVLDALAARAAALGSGAAPDGAPPLRIREAESIRQALDASTERLRARERSLAEALEREAGARAEAEQANRAKDEFLAMMSHELRNPMSGIKTATAVLGMPNRSADVEARARAVIARQTGHLAEIVDDLMDMARLNSGKVVLTRRRLDAAPLVVRVVEGFRDAGRCHHLEIATELESVWVFADETRLEQIVSNLLDNACKYTPAGGHATLALRAEDGWAVLTVKDDGAGIGAELLPRVFDLFTQGERTLARTEGGLGLGLPVVRRLVQLHGGSIEVESAGPGMGTTFTLRLPRAPERAPSVGAPGPAVPIGSRRIVIVEDSADSRDSMAALLGLEGHHVTTAENGAEGVAAILREPCDLALVDLGLPDIDGHEVARRVRAATGTDRIALIALTGHGTAEDRSLAVRSGFDDFIVKPFDIDRLHALLATLESARRGSAAP